MACAYKFFLSYLMRFRPKAKRSPLAFGDSIDVGLNTLLETRDLDLAIAKFSDQWITYRDKGIQFSKSDLEAHLFEANENPDAWESLNRRGRILLEEYNEQIMPRIKEVIAVQIDDTVKNEHGDELVIKTDFICVWEDGRRILFDNKTSSQKYADDSVRTSPQLATYFETLKEKYALDVAGYIVIPKKINKKKKPRVAISVIIDQIDEETFHKTLEEYDQVLADIKSAHFPQNKKECMGKFGRCEFYNYCHSNSMEGIEVKNEKKT